MLIPHKISIQVKTSQGTYNKIVTIHCEQTFKGMSKPEDINQEINKIVFSSFMKFKIESIQWSFI